MALFGTSKMQMVSPDQALLGRGQGMVVPRRHRVLGTAMVGDWPSGVEVAYFAVGCFWGAERRFWGLEGVYSTAVGYMGGYTPNPIYDEVCSGKTGHAEAVMVCYDPRGVAYWDLLRQFWAMHNPTQGMRQGNDVGTQYRSAIYTLNADQAQAAMRSRDMFQEILDRAGVGRITTQIEPAGPFYYAEPEHQQHLHTHPNGYCGLGGTGLVLD